MNFSEWIKKEFWVIIVLLVSLLLCMYALNSVKDVEQRCNEHWVQEFKDKCMMYQTSNVPSSPYPEFNFTTTLVPDHQDYNSRQLSES